MKKSLLAAVVATSAILAVSAQAAPVAPAVKGEVSTSAQNVAHCRYWSGGWGCGYGHSRYWSHRRWGSRHW
jgi:opacity protein-like surface antigen